MNKNRHFSEIIDRVLQNERNAISLLIDSNYEPIIECIHLIDRCKGKVILTGVGKSAFVAQKIASTLNSTGTPAIFLHSSDAMHGDVGVINKDDILIFISKSGGTKELISLMDFAKRMDLTTISINNNASSYLTQNSTNAIVCPEIEEGDSDNIIPTSSVITHLAVGDAIALALQEVNSFTAEDFGRLHPSGTLGKLLNRSVGELAAKHAKPKVEKSDTLQSIIYEISSNRLGASCVVDDSDKVVGIITDGDIRRMLENITDLSGITAESIMTPTPYSILNDSLAKDAIEIIRSKSINQLIVTDASNTYIGMIHIQDLINE